MEKKRYTQPHICICRKCEGTGKTYSYQPEDVLRLEPILIECDLCNGVGRVVVRKETTITITPYITDKDVCLQ